jgi:hypothetical protein
MSLSQTYFIASTARAKLGKEACKPDHNLRRLVGHANLLDNLMLELRDAEREQEAWFNHSVKKAEDHQTQHIRWADTMVQDEEYDDEDSSDSDSDSDFDEAEFEMATPLRRIRSPPVTITSQEVEELEADDTEDVYEDLEDSPELALTRTDSHPPELIHDSDSEDDSPPASPPQPNFSFNEKTSIVTVTLPKKGKVDSSNFTRDEYYISEQEAPLIEAY